MVTCLSSLALDLLLATVSEKTREESCEETFVECASGLLVKVRCRVRGVVKMKGFEDIPIK